MGRQALPLLPRLVTYELEITASCGLSRCLYARVCVMQSLGTAWISVAGAMVGREWDVPIRSPRPHETVAYAVNISHKKGLHSGALK